MQGANFEVEEEYPLKEETGIIINIGYEIYKHLGAGFLEIVYKDAYEYEFQARDVFYEREKEYLVKYKTTILKHTFNSDFVVFGKVILEVKAKQGGLAKEDFAQAINYLKVSGCKIALLVNFTKEKLEVKRVIY
jgi:GxxExxY protein